MAVDGLVAVAKRLGDDRRWALKHELAQGGARATTASGPPDRLHLPPYSPARRASTAILCGAIRPKCTSLGPAAPDLCGR
jgi:hypothetical protein